MPDLPLPPDATAPAAQVTPTAAATTLAHTLQAFEQWRTSKTNPGEPIPDGLWHAIFALEAHFAPAKLRTLFGLNLAQYQKKQQELLPLTAGTPPTGPIASTATALPFCEAKPPPFYEPAPLPVTAPPLIVELCRTDGRIMKIYTSADRFTTLLEQFFEGDHHAADHRPT